VSALVLLVAGGADTNGMPTLRRAARTTSTAVLRNFGG